jgi:hypothetical protein
MARFFLLSTVAALVSSIQGFIHPHTPKNYAPMIRSAESLLHSTATTVVEDEKTPEEKAFFDRTKVLCNERNLSLMKVKNARDLASVANSPIEPNRIYRTGRLSDATAEDTALLFGDEIGIRTLIDLRSPTELKDDPTLDREEVFGNFSNLIWVERDHGKVVELNAGEPRMKKKEDKKRVRDHVKDLVGGVKSGVDAALHDTPLDSVEDESELNYELKNIRKAVDISALVTPGDDEEELLIETDRLIGDDVDADFNGDDALKGEKKHKRFVKEYLPGTIGQDKTRGTRKERHFVSLMNELKYVKGTLSKLRKRDIAKVIIKSPGAIVSKRVRTGCKDVFLSEINAGGLPMLNDLILRFGAPGIKYVLDLCADTSRHPIAFYCTAGKDRTGVIAAVILALIGVPEEDIVEDYSLSANVYAEMNDNKAMVGALKQRSVDPKTFLGAPPSVMKATLQIIKENYGSVEGYCDYIGFGKDDREKLKSALLLK